MENKITVLIIGYGNFGITLAKMFANMSTDIQILAVSSRYLEGESEGKTKFTTLEKGLQKADLIFPCVPISSFEDWLIQNGETLSRLRKDQAMVEVCSVNELSSKWMREQLNEDVALISSHPLFGPDSTKEGTTFRDLRFVWHELRCGSETLQKKINRLREEMQSLGLNLIDLPPSEHDKLMAKTHAFTFLMGKIGQELGLTETAVDTYWFRHYLKVQHMVEHDTEQLFIDLFKFNPYAGELFEDVMEKVDYLRGKIEKE